MEERLDMVVEATCPVCKGKDEYCLNCAGSGLKTMTFGEAVHRMNAMISELMAVRQKH